MKGPNVDSELKMAESFKEFYTLEKDIPYNLKHTENQRRLVIYRKIKNSPIPNEDETEDE